MTEEDIKLAKVLLLKILKEKPRTLPEIYAYCQSGYRIRKSEIKAARIELGIKSELIDGVRYWSLPKEV